MSEWCAENLRDCQAWKESDLPVSTTSNEAAKLYDAVLRQYLSWIDCEALGGLEKSCKSLLEADPTFVLGRTLVLGLEVVGTGRSTRLDKEFASQIDELYADSLKSSITEREKMHARAIKQFADGLMTKACETWEAILKEHPTDLLALKFVHDAYFYMGNKVGLRDSVAQIYPKWTPDIPGYSYLKGMWAFGLEECGEYDLAEKYAREALDARRHDAWATHAVAHCYEMNGRYEEGIKFLSSTVQDWSACNFLACHNYWHYALYQIEKKDYEAAMDIFDKEIGRRCASGMMLDLVDACSLLYRFQLEGIPLGSRWDPVYEYCRPHWDDHILSFNDAHICMSIVGKGDEDGLARHRDSIVEFIKSEVGDNSELSAKYGLPICEALAAFKSSDYQTAVDKLYPIRDQIYNIGGSHAQRDVFDQLLIHSCLKSTDVSQNKLAKELILRRNAMKPGSTLAERLACQFKTLHLD